MVSILLIIDSYHLNRYVIETLLRNCGEMQIELLVVNNSQNELISSFLADLVKSDSHKNVVGIGEIDELTFNRASAFNKLIKEAKGEYICVFDSHSLVSKNWLYDLQYYHDFVQKSGVVAIPDFDTKKTYTTLLDNNDGNINVWKSSDNSVNGILFFKKELVDEIGTFNDFNENGFMEEFSIAASKKGYENFYVCGQIKTSSDIKKAE